VFSQKENVDVYKASEAPVIDGEEDEVWEFVEANVFNKPLMPADIPTPSEGTFKVLWNDTALFVLIKFDDDDHFPFHEMDGSAGYENYNMDHIEVYIDVNDVLDDGKGPNDGDGNYSVDPGFEPDGEGSTLFSSGWAGHTVDRYWGYTMSGEGYTMEIAIPFGENLINNNGENFVPEPEKIVGFDVVVIDRDEYSADIGRQRLMWQNDNSTEEGDPWVNMDNCGTLTFKNIITSNEKGLLSVYNISVYPNPASSTISVNCCNFTNAIITDLNGKSVIESENNIINISDLHNGLYFISFYNKNRLIGNCKFLKY
jgi:hypothetical protein